MLGLKEFVLDNFKEKGSLALKELFLVRDNFPILPTSPSFFQQRHARSKIMQISGKKEERWSALVLLGSKKKKTNKRLLAVYVRPKLINNK